MDAFPAYPAVPKDAIKAAIIVNSAFCLNTTEAYTDLINLTVESSTEHYKHVTNDNLIQIILTDQINFENYLAVFNITKQDVDKKERATSSGPVRSRSASYRRKQKVNAKEQLHQALLLPANFAKILTTVSSAIRESLQITLLSLLYKKNVIHIHNIKDQQLNEMVRNNWEFWQLESKTHPALSEDLIWEILKETCPRLQGQ